MTTSSFHPNAAASAPTQPSQAQEPTLSQLRSRLGVRGFDAAIELSRQGSPTRAKLGEVARRYQRTSQTLVATIAAFDLVIAIARRARRRQAPLLCRCPHSEPSWLLSTRLPLAYWLRPLRVRLAEKLTREEEARREVIRRYCRELPNATRYESQRVERLPAEAPLSAATALAELEKGERYSTRCTWRMTYATYTVKIAANWETAVRDQGIDFKGGLLTLAAEPIPTEVPGEKVWAAVWAGKGRGFHFEVESGYIVTHGTDLAHGASIATCRATLTRRAHLVRVARLEGKVLSLLQGPSAALEGLGGTKVTVADSLRAGNCEPGTENFASRHFPEGASATVREVIAAAEKEGISVRHQAVLACWQAIKHRGSRTVLALTA